VPLLIASSKEADSIRTRHLQSFLGILPLPRNYRTTRQVRIIQIQPLPGYSLLAISLRREQPGALLRVEPLIIILEVGPGCWHELGELIAPLPAD
jgi:hypothetical protein